MAQKKASYLRVVEPPKNNREVKKKVRRVRMRNVQNIIVTCLLLALALCGTYLLLNNQTYSKVKKSSGIENNLSDTNNYRRFENGIIRYSRDGVAFLNRRNEEVWVQSTQLQNPIIELRENAFAVADNGGNNILVFTREGLKGEIETPLPIEQITLSEQGIVSVILKSENSPQIVTYDAAGNILVEHQITLASMGYPLSIELSDDGTVLIVSYLMAEGSTLKSRVVYYSYGDEGKEKPDNVVASQEYKNSLMAEIFFMGGERSVLVGDHSFVVCKNNTNPEIVKEVVLDQEIQRVFHSDQYIGFVLLNNEKSGYEVRLYDKSGAPVMNHELSGEYSNIRLDGNEIIMFDESRCCIMMTNGVIKYKGNIKSDAKEMLRAPGVNRYYVISADEWKTIYLAK